jgi:hypothetical protein
MARVKRQEEEICNETERGLLRAESQSRQV